VPLPLPQLVPGAKEPRIRRGPVQQRSIAAADLDAVVAELRASMPAGARLELTWQVVTEFAEPAAEES
jgi:hypothetical protein